MPDKLSVLIPTLNEEENIAACIESIGELADQIVVFDSFSTDRTLEIARSLRAEIHQRKFDDYATQKNAALELLQHDWILILDADERLTLALREEIRTIIQQAPANDGYLIRRDAYFLNKRVRCWSTGWVLRLFRKGHGRFASDKPVHEKLVLNGNCARLHHPILHYTFRSFSQYLSKVDSFTSLAAREAYQKGERSSLRKLFFYPQGRFIKTYFLRAGILDGIPGILIAWLSAYSIYLKYAKLWELQRNASKDSSSKH